VLHERLWRAWSVQKRSVPIIPALYFSPDGLALGAGTILLPAVGPRRLADLQGEEARLLALLSATYGKAISPSVLRNIERAAKSWRVGDDALAAIHLAHAAQPRPDNPDEAARRLFVTDAFIKAGTNPLAILQALGLDAGYVETLARASRQQHPQRPLDEDSFIPRRFDERRRSNSGSGRHVCSARRPSLRAQSKSSARSSSRRPIVSTSKATSPACRAVTTRGIATRRSFLRATMPESAR